MLTIVIQPTGTEMFDEINDRFVYSVPKPVQIVLEHSLVSLSKWESKHHKHFINNKDITTEELIDYFRCMTITQNVDPDVYYSLTEEQVKQITDYIADPMTGTVIKQYGKKETGPSRFLTNETIYSKMAALQIPFTPCEKWHLNRLLTLIRVCAIEQQPPNKMSRAETLSSIRAMNAARRKK